MRTDCLLLTGRCPFRPLPGSEAPGLLLERLGLGAGIFVSVESLFYHRPHAGLEAARRAMEGAPSAVRLHGTCHPLLGEKPEEAWGPRVASVLLAPGMHHYRLAEPRVTRLVESAAARGLPVVLLRRLGDARLAPDWFAPLEEPIEAVLDFIMKAPPCRMVLSQFTPGEIAALLPQAAARPGLYVELGGFLGEEGWFETQLARAGFNRWLFGTAAPLHYSRGMRLSLEDAAAASGFASGRFDENACACYGS